MLKSTGDWWLNYLTVIRSDITFTVSIVSQFLSTPKTTHLEAVMRILRHMKKTSGRGLFYSNHGHFRVANFSDADWAKCLLIGGRSRDIVFFFEKILCHEKVRNRVWSLGPVQSQRTCNTSFPEYVLRYIF